MKYANQIIQSHEPILYVWGLTVVTLNLGFTE